MLVKSPDGNFLAVTIDAHEFEGHEGGLFRVSLTYNAPSRMGKTPAHTDTYHGYFKELVPNKRVVEVIEFESSDPAMRGEMITTVEILEINGATQLTGR